MKTKARVLVVDDERSMQEFLEIFLRSEGYEVETAGDVQSAKIHLENDDFDVVITDIRMPGGSGIDLLHAAHEVSPETVVIMITAYASTETAIAAMKEGAYDYVTKPFKVDELRIVVEKALEKKLLTSENKRLRSELRTQVRDRSIIGSSPLMQRVFDLIAQVADSKANVLITGESGTGKEMVARAIHYRSSRRDGPFVPVNCGAIPESLTENELFGHERGAFTDARGTQAGLVGQADGGTLFLDEVDALSAKAQVALLRFLQDNEYRPLGSRKVHKTDVRVVAATNADLAGLVRDRSFREDLLFRLNVLTIKLPTLRERCEDIALLAQHFIQQSSAKYDRPPKSLHPETLVWMRRYDWPGNVRELENLIEREFLMGEGATLRLSPPSEMRMERRQRAGDRRKLAGFDGAFNRIKAHVMEDFELRYLRWVLAETHGNVTLAATRAGKERRALGKLLKKHGINPRDFAPER
jgi:two-component system response regulator PilR (NtrC family)